jgi:hypothetical protein
LIFAGCRRADVIKAKGQGDPARATALLQNRQQSFPANSPWWPGTVGDNLWLMKKQDPGPAPHAVSRRRFGRRAALTAVAGVLSSPLLDSQVGANALPAGDQAEVDAKYANVIRKYGARLSPVEKVRARETLLDHQRMLKRIRDFALDNGDAPATGLRLYPSDTPERRD